MSDDDLKARFDALRDEDRRRAPSFGAVLARKRRPSSRPLAFAAAWAVAIACMAWIYYRDAPPGTTVAVGLREPEPLAFLLAPIPSLEESP